jgi:hypothetical protein
MRGSAASCRFSNYTSLFYLRTPSFMAMSGLELTEI